MRRRVGFTLIEVVLAMLLLILGTVWVGQALEPIQAQARVRRAVTNQVEAPRRAIAAFVATAGNLALNGTATNSYDSVSVVTTRVANTQLSTVPRLRFVITDQRPAAGARPDTFSVDFHPLLTGVGYANSGDRRP